MSKTKMLSSAVLIGLACAAVGGAATWWLTQARPQKAQDESSQTDMSAYRYVSLDKVIVMLRGAEGEPVSHYLAVDLVFKTPEDNERLTREQLPLLRSVAVSVLSDYTLERARRMTIDEIAEVLNTAFTQAYANDRAGMPFTEAMIGKLIIE